MPELPEVETVRRGLVALLPGHKVKKVTHDTEKSFPNATHDVEQFLIGATITDVRRRAKVLMIDLSTKYSLVIHLKMTGQIVYVRNDQMPNPKHQTSNSSENSNDKILVQALQGRHPELDLPAVPVWQAGSGSNPNHTGVVIPAKAGISKITGSSSSLSDEAAQTSESNDRIKYGMTEGGVPTETRFGAGHPNNSLVNHLPDRSTRVTLELDKGTQLFFNDQRKFGWMRLMPTIEIPNIDFMKKVGPEPLEDSFTAKEFIQRLNRRKNTTIKAAILDQTVLAGVGNIYADESLWGAKIHPATRVKDVPQQKLKNLFKEIRAVMSLSIEKDGSTDKNYVNAEGGRGSYLTFANVFRREGQPCTRHPNVLIEKIKVAGRGTHICPRCQDL